MTEPGKKFAKINQGSLYRYDQDFYKRLNNVYIDTIAVTRFLESASRGKFKNVIKGMPKNIQVPSHKGSASVKRSEEDVFEIFRIAASTGQWEKSLTLAISITEDQVAGYIRLILRAKPIMILTSMSGNEGHINVPLVDIIKIGSGKIVEERIRARVSAAIQANPSECANYLATLLQYQIPKTIIDPYIEMKARRDLIIHAGGIVDDQYIRKTKDVEGASKLSEKIVVNRGYFEESMRGIKRFTSSIYRQAVKQYGDDIDMQNVLAEYGI